MKAPSAKENPARSARKASTNSSPATTMVGSSSPALMLSFRSSHGTTSMPPMPASAMNAPSRPSVIQIETLASPIWTSELRIASMTIATTSSSTEMPSAIWPLFSCMAPISWSTLLMIAELDTMSIAARNGGLDRAPAQRAADRPAEIVHDDGAGERRQHQRKAESPELPQAQAHADGKHQEHQPHLRERLDPADVRHQGERRRVRADDHAGHEVADDRRQADAVASPPHQPRHQHDHREVLDEIDSVHGVLRLRRQRREPGSSPVSFANRHWPIVICHIDPAPRS